MSSCKFIVGQRVIIVRPSRMIHDEDLDESFRDYVERHSSSSLEIIKISQERPLLKWNIYVQDDEEDISPEPFYEEELKLLIGDWDAECNDDSAEKINSQGNLSPAY